MEEDEISYKTLRKIQQMEKNSPVLTDLRPNFYNELSEFLENLENRLDSETSSQKQTLLKEEISNIKKIAVNIYELREKKILLAVVTKARGGNPDLKNITDVEHNIYDPVLELLQRSRKQILESKKNENNVEDEKEDEPIEPEKPDENDKNTNPIVRVTEDIPEFIGTDTKKYNLRKNDVLSLPEDMSKMLTKRGAVKRINK